MNTLPVPASPRSDRIPIDGGRWPRLSAIALAVGMLAIFGGCETPPSAASEAAPSGSARPVEAFTLQEGDVLKISFPGAPNLDSTQTVRRDGKITLALVGELVAVGRTPTELEQELLKLYSTQLVTKEVSVMVVSSSYAIFVSGAVLHPGKILAERPLTALEAIMEAGGFDNAKADMKAVKVVRQEGGGTKNYILNLKTILDGKSSESFYLKRSDIVYVPEKFSLF
jgi:polysaccharide export outer membrane protein